MNEQEESSGNAKGGLIRARYRLGPETELLVLSDGECRFDGGAMFGVVPKALWSRVIKADEHNKIAVGLNTVVVRTTTPTGVHTTVIETGFGEKLSPKIAAITGVQARLLDAFAEAEVPLDSVGTVINTHLHWDHCGWNTRFGPDGVLPTFTRANYLAHAGEIAHGRARHERDAVSYVGDNYEPLLRSGQMQPLALPEGEEREVAPGIAVELYPGHTRQLMAVHIRDGISPPPRLLHLRPHPHHGTPATYLESWLRPGPHAHDRRKETVLRTRHPRAMAGAVYPRPPHARRLSRANGSRGKDLP